MNITNKYPLMVFKNDYDGKTFYNIGISKKEENGSYTNGYIPCRFKKGVNVENKTKIKLKNAWLDFYLKENKSIHYIFVNDFEIVKDNSSKNSPPASIKSDDINLSDSDLPF